MVPVLENSEELDRRINITMQRTTLILLQLALLTLTGACGGGSGGNSTPTPEASVNTAAQTSNTQTADECSGSGSQLDCTFNHDGLVREYILYVPQSYTGSESVPLLFNFHGYGSSAIDQMNYGDFRVLAEEEQFILLVPHGTLLEDTAHWNVGSWTSESTVDDIGFTSALIDKIATDYLIDLSRIYSTGMSNGGYMSHQLACLLSDNFAAIASVTGSMSPETFTECTPTHATSILQIHGTEDDVVPYTGANWTKSMEAIMDYWSAYNGCDPAPSVTALPDTNEDGTIADLIAYTNCINNVEVELYRMNEMGHTWPEPGRGWDISGVNVIWRFLSRHSLNGVVE
jgi:polyhydroxybutyrate depolymerase|tara:strand:- start:1745 stop:2776 length:1032 start_codon:yes stop_codon:yes gene_type:complete